MQCPQYFNKCCWFQIRTEFNKFNLIPWQYKNKKIIIIPYSHDKVRHLITGLNFNKFQNVNSKYVKSCGDNVGNECRFRKNQI